ncbi:MAG: polyphosphate kinase 1 [Gammaproteobacteria bacterium]|nr:polyphosphate kinase 1 [Gammaproteobacteria bacterium]
MSQPAAAKSTNIDQPDARAAAEVKPPQRWDHDNLNDPSLYINRELSLLQFNRRVLELALDESLPLLERVRFLCISCTNLDEFFEVRVASELQRQKLGLTTSNPDGLSPTEALQQIRASATALVHDQYHCFNKILLPMLAREDIRVVRRKDWTKKQKKWLHKHFLRELMPVLSPLGLDPVHPFPRILNKSLNFAVSLEGVDAFGREADMALVQAPRSLPRIIRIPASYASSQHEFVFLSDVLHCFMSELFPGMTVNGCYQFRVTRDSELFVDEEEIEDLARALQGELEQRGYAEAVRLEISNDCPADVLKFLMNKFSLDDQAVYYCDGPVNLNRLSAIHDLVDRPDLKYRSFKPRIPLTMRDDSSIFAAIRKHDHVLHHPYDSFAPVIDLLRQASTDPNVLAIKQTLYRTGADSIIVKLLVDAARNGKDVTVVVELRARFDEQANIQLATRLQEAGVQVVYGIVGHKTHAKLMLIVRRENGRIRRYAHLGTGNYHQVTANLYTDWCLLTDHRGICEDVHKIFQQLSGMGRVPHLKHLLHSPFTLHQTMLEHIEAEIEHALAGRTALIRARMNSLTETSIMQALYRASRAGVRIQLLIRGICCLRPGIPGLSENIEVRSVLGRFLEHSRVFYFHNDGHSKLYAASADWMDRNLFHRVETCFPILDKKNARRMLQDSLELPFRDDIQAWIMSADGSYRYRQYQEPEQTDGSAAQDSMLQRQEEVLLGQQPVN